MRRLFVLFVIFLLSLPGNAQNDSKVKVEPPNWWAGLKNPNLQLLVYGKDIGGYLPEISDKSVKIGAVHKAGSPNYLFIDLDLSRLKKPQRIDIVFKRSGHKPIVYPYDFRKRKPGASMLTGFNSSDVIYLITPDRFANGDAKNDIVPHMRENKTDRKDAYARHGGDIKGMIDHLDYISGMGFTTIWPTPLLENDMPESSYHGYAITDFYKVDLRFGNLQDYIKLSEKTHEKGLKMIMDQVANHCGIEHWWMKDLPFDDWVNYEKDFKERKIILTNHRRTTNQDPYASKTDFERMHRGWFVKSMPDLNQKNPFMAQYLIQNSIWWIETLGLNGIRQDTYPYPDKEFMAKWAGAIMHEYPNFSIVGEEWSYNPLLVGYWQMDSRNKDGYRSNLTSIMDFPMQKAIIDGLNEEESWDTGLIRLYEGLANDFYYAHPEKIMAFLDNHDKSRVFTEFKKDIVKTKMALSYLLMLPRIPQIYYGTEIGMHDMAKPGDHGLIRSDFPGGWPDDKVNAFTGKGLTAPQKDLQNFLRILLNYRKGSAAIHRGKTLHFAPENGVYVILRSFEDETVILILNKNEAPITLDLNRFSETGLDGKKVKNILTGEVLIWDKKLIFSKKGSVLLSTKL